MPSRLRDFDADASAKERVDDLHEKRVDDLHEKLDALHGKFDTLLALLTPKADEPKNDQPPAGS